MNTKKTTASIILIAMVVAMVFAAISVTTVVADISSPNDCRDFPVSAYTVPTSLKIPDVTPGICGPIDLVIVLDDTGSMCYAIDNVKAELPTIIETANIASGGDFRLGYITFKDDVTVHNALTTDISAVTDSINNTSASGGGGGPEASDEAKNTAVNNLPEGSRMDSAGNSGMQYGNFTTPYRAEATKIVVLITDAPPGGFNDSQDPEDTEAMHTHALEALDKEILVSDVFIGLSGATSDIFEDDANTTGGVFVLTSDGTDTGTAIAEIVAACGGEEPDVPCVSVPVGPDTSENVPLLTPFGAVILIGLLAIAGAVGIRRRT